MFAAARLSGTPLAEYDKEDIQQGYRSEKPCAPHCTISCVHKVSAMDFWRDPQTEVAPRINPNTFVHIQAATQSQRASNVPAAARR